MKALIDQGRFALLPALQVLGLLTFAWGGAWPWLGGSVLLAVNFLFDDLGGEYEAIVEQPNRLFLDAVLYSSIPLVGLLTIGLLLYTASPGTPMAGLAAQLGIGASGTPWWSMAGVVFSAGLLCGWATGSFGHELMHRTTRGEWMLGQLLLARDLYAAYAIEHVYGHHVRVGTPEDLSTAPRGLGFWRYMARALVATQQSAFRIEADRLKRRGLPWYTGENRFIQGAVIGLALVVAVFAVAGLSGLFAYLLTGALGVLIIEIANYVAHFGLVRVPGRPVEPRHSWNSPRFFSTSTMVNVQRHSHHHRSAGTRYWHLSVLDDAPVYPFGLAVVAAIAFVPPLWRRFMRPLLDEWDRRLASPEERELLRAK